jgi:hypothetical protein
VWQGGVRVRNGGKEWDGERKGKSRGERKEERAKAEREEEEGSFDNKRKEIKERVRRLLGHM